nr:hypothetical protein OG999_19335 [Streptomyces sp. NBC_00886]
MAGEGGQIVNDLADHAQVILYSQFWRVDAGHTYGISGTGLDWELGWATPWEHLVEEARMWSLPEATPATSAPRTVRGVQLNGLIPAQSSGTVVGV